MEKGEEEVKNVGENGVVYGGTKKIKNKYSEQKNLVCMYTNLRSIMNDNKRGEIGELLQYRDVDILGITESWTHDAIGDQEIEFKGYVTFRRDRVVGDKIRGGGVLLYVRESIRAEQISEKGQGESLWVKVGRGSRNEIIIGICYRSQTAPREEVESLYREIRKFSVHRNALIMGDFNYREINWAENLGNSKGGQELLNLAGDCFLSQLVRKPTRGKYILDLVFCSDPEMVEDLEVSCPVANSDHNLMVFKVVRGKWGIVKMGEVYRYQKGNYREIRSGIRDGCWVQKLGEKAVQDGWNLFRKELLKLRDMWVPKVGVGKGRGGRTSPMWMTEGIRKEIKKRNRAWKRLREAPSFLLEEKYKKLRNRVAQKIRSAKANFEIQLADKIKDDSKTFYAYVNSKSKGRKCIGPLKDSRGEVVADDAGMGNILNEFFGSVFTREELTNVPGVERRGAEKNGVKVKLEVIEFTEENVAREIQRLKKNKAAGEDGLVSSFIKELEGDIAAPLAVLFNKSFREGLVPVDWKSANISPIHKKGSRSDPGNYRPVSLTSQVGKLMERVIKSEMVKFLEGNKVLKDSQHGFREGRSCLTNLLEFVEEMSLMVDGGEQVDVVFLDFSKAFDKVPHERLLVKLESYGIYGQLLGWIREWLRGRRQRVVINGVGSSWSEVVSGVPQGSILGPVLFLLFVDDLEEGVVSRVFKFADDVKMFGGVGTEERVNVFRKDLKRMEDWALKWQMSFNVEKCKVMGLGFRNKKVSYLINGRVLERVHEEKDLGIVISSDLKVGRQCAKAASKGNQILGMIYRTFSTRDRGVMLKLYKSLVRPHLEYCGPAWTPHLRKDVDVLERVQRRATKMMEGMGEMDYSDRLAALGLTTLETRRIRADLIELYKLLRGGGGRSLRGFELRLDRGGRRGHGLKLFKNRVRLEVGKHSFSNRVCQVWNGLPEGVVRAGSVNVFKGGVDRYLRGV